MAKREFVSELTEKEFFGVINDKKKRLVIVDFWAEWCFPCAMMAPIIEKFAEKYPEVKFAKINVDDAGNLAKEYEITSIPCIIFFKEGKEVDRTRGAVSEDILKEKISDYLKSE